MKMKALRAGALVLFFLLLRSVGGYAQGTMRIATFNIRYDNKGDVGNLWKDRAPVVASLIRFHEFDIFGTQEGYKNQLDDLIAALPGFARFGAGRNDGQEAGEHSAIFYRKDKFKILTSGNFWLSETPDKPGLGWDAKCCNRLASWVQFQPVRGGKKFYVFNVHYDHEGVVARSESSKLMIKKIAEIAGSDPVVLTGDLNGARDSEPYKILAASILHDTFLDVKDPYALNSSFNAWGKSLAGDQVIDHIFTNRYFEAVKWGILTDTYHGKFPSDHFPVVADIKYR